MKTSIIERSVCEHAVQECNEEDDDRYGPFQSCSQKSTVAVLHRFPVQLSADYRHTDKHLGLVMTLVCSKPAVIALCCTRQS